jgi:hypothetical protein
MRHLVIIHQKNGLPDLEDEYADEKAALDALRQIAVLAGAGGETPRAMQGYCGAQSRYADLHG